MKRNRLFLFVLFILFCTIPQLSYSQVGMQQDSTLSFKERSFLSLGFVGGGYSYFNLDFGAALTKSVDVGIGGSYGILFASEINGESVLGLDSRNYINPYIFITLHSARGKPRFFITEKIGYSNVKVGDNPSEFLVRDGVTSTTNLGVEFLNKNNGGVGVFVSSLLHFDKETLETSTDRYGNTSTYTVGGNLFRFSLGVNFIINFR